MSIIPKYDDQIIEEALDKGYLGPNDIGWLLRELGQKFSTSPYSYGWQTAERLCAAGRLVKVGPSRYAADSGHDVLIGLPELADADPVALEKAKACLLLGVEELKKAAKEADGGLKEWIQGCVDRCSRDGSFIEALLEEGKP